MTLMLKRLLGLRLWFSTPTVLARQEMMQLPLHVAASSLVQDRSSGRMDQVYLRKSSFSRCVLYSLRTIKLY